MAFVKAFNGKQFIKAIGVLSCFLFCYFGYATEHLTIAINPNAPPAPAIKTILKQAYETIGVSVEFIELPGRRSLVHANRGRADAEAFRVKGADDIYKNLVMVDVPLRSDKMYLFVKQGKEFPVNGFASIPSDYVVGFRRGLLFAELGVRQYNLRYNELPSASKTGLHLNTGRSDVVILGAIANELFQQLNAQHIVRLEPHIYTTELYHYVHKSHQHLIPKLTHALQQMHLNGELNRINNK